MQISREVLPHSSSRRQNKVAHRRQLDLAVDKELIANTGLLIRCIWNLKHATAASILTLLMHFNENVRKLIDRLR